MKRRGKQAAPVSAAGALRYVGPRNASGEPSGFFGVPARDLAAEEVAALSVTRARLVESGLYAPAEGAGDGVGDVTGTQAGGTDSQPAEHEEG